MHKYAASFIIATGLLIGFTSPLFASAAPVVSSVTVTFEQKDPPRCEARASKRTMRSGDAVNITWKSKGAMQMVGLTKDDTWPTKGKQRVMIAHEGKHTFPLAFIGKGGIALCPVTVFVHPKRDRGR